MTTIKVTTTYNAAGGVKIVPGVYTQQQLGRYAPRILDTGRGYIIENAATQEAVQPVEEPTPEPEAEETALPTDIPTNRDVIKSRLDERGIEYDGRWATEKLQEMLEANV